jgi:hypothetical protein
MYFGNVYLLRSLSESSFASFGNLKALVGYETGQAWFPGRTAKPRHDGVIGLISATPVGVVFIGGAIADQGDRKVLFRVGRTF